MPALPREGLCKELQLVSDFKNVFDRIKLATNTKTQIDVADVLGIRQSSISDAKRRNSVPADWCLKLFAVFGLNPDWIMSGTGPMYLKTADGYGPVDPEQPLMANEDPGIYREPEAKSALVSVYAMLEPPRDGADGKVVSKLSMPASFAAPSVTVFQLDSSDMEPLMRKGAYIGVDSKQTALISGELYAVYMPYGGLAVRRLFPDSEGKNVMLRAENAGHPEATLPMGKIKDAIAGRVVWTLNKY